MNLQILTVTRVFLIVILGAAVLSPAASASTRAERKLQKQVKQLKAENKALGKHNANLRSTITTLQSSEAGLKNSVATMQSEAVKAAADLKTMTTLRDAETARANLALQGLPNMVRAVPSGDLFTLVLFPARDVWACDSWYQSDGYYSLDFPKCF